MKLDGCTAIVTGGSSGIGLAAAGLLAAGGANVALLARDAERLEAAREAVHAQAKYPSQRIVSVPCDVSDRVQDDAAVCEAEVTLGRSTCPQLRGYCTPGRFLELTEDEIERQIRVNLLGTINPTRAVGPHDQRGHGYVATWPRWRLPRRVGYSATAPPSRRDGFLGGASLGDEPHGIA